MADFYENERVFSLTNQSSVAHTTGTLNGPTLVNGLSTVTTATAGADIGSVFTVAGVFQCHPETKAAYSALQQFTVTATNSGLHVHDLARDLHQRAAAERGVVERRQVHLDEQRDLGGACW
jgi:hypothetical protein